MPYKSRFDLQMEHVAIPSFLFGSPNAPITSQKKIFIDANRPSTHFFSLHTFREWSKRFAAGLKAKGFRTGDRVILFSGNSIFTPIVVMGTIMAGGIYTSANPQYMPHELAHQLRLVDPAVVLIADQLWEKGMKGSGLAAMSTDKLHVFAEPDLDSPSSLLTDSNGRRSFLELLASPTVGSIFEWEELDVPEKSTRGALLLFSSGTTGLPKTNNPVGIP